MREIHYRRLSQAADESTSIERQGRDLDTATKADGNVLVADLVDEGISGRIRRDKADIALRMLRDDEADVLRVWKFDRWSRMGLSAIADLIAVLDASPGKLFISMQDGLRSDQPAWRIIAAVLAEVARMEAEATALRVRSSREHARRLGTFHGGTVPFGYRVAPHPTLSDKKTLAPEPLEAAAIRSLAARAIAGESLTSLMDYLNAHGPAPHRAPRWTANTLQGVLTGHVLVGRITYSGEPVYGEDGAPLAPYEPLIDLDTFYALRERFADPRWRSKQAGTPRPLKRRPKQARLLSGLCYCITCNSVLYANALPAYTRADGEIVDRDVYTCSARGQGKPCEAPVRISAEVLEQHVADEFLAFYGDLPHTIATETYVGPSPSAKAEVAESITATLDAMRAPDADMPALVERLSALKSREAELEAQPSRVVVTRTPTGRTLSQVWADPDTPLAERRGILSGALDHIVVARGRRGARFDPSRVDVVWASGEAAER